MLKVIFSEQSFSRALGTAAPPSCRHLKQVRQGVEAAVSNARVFFGPDAGLTGSGTGAVDGSSSASDDATGLYSELRSRRQWVRVPPRPPTSQRISSLLDASLLRRFWSKVSRADGDGCWEWTGQRTRRGCGRLQIGSRKTWRGPAQAQVIAHGEIPDGLVVRHVVCGNFSCCRHEHMALGTQADNCRDTVAMGRSLVGERNHQAKLREADVVAILEGLKVGITRRELAERHGVDPAAIGQIANGKTWRHLIPAPAQSVQQ